MHLDIPIHSPLFQSLSTSPPTLFSQPPGASPGRSQVHVLDRPAGPRRIHVSAEARVVEATAGTTDQEGGAGVELGHGGQRLEQKRWNIIIVELNFNFF